MGSSISHSPEAVCKIIALDLRSKGITHEEAGKAIGKSRVAVSNILYRKKYFSKKMAELFSRAFGYNLDFLMYGRGDLTKETIASNSNKLQWSNDSRILISEIDILEALLGVSGNNELINAWSLFKKGDYDGFQAHLHNAEMETGLFYSLSEGMTSIVCSIVSVEKYNKSTKISKEELEKDPVFLKSICEKGTSF